jgi:uncharacterized membrane protein YhaH (DUF805 family)
MYDYQSSPDAGLGMIPILFLLGVYVYFAFCLFKVAQKSGHQDCAWWAWIPILNTFLLFKIAGKPAWWFVLCLVPLVNIVVFAILWMEAAKAVQALGIMAFSAMPQHTPPAYTPQPREPEHVG